MTTLPQSITKLAPRAVKYGHIRRWLWLALPEDVNQEIELTFIEYPKLTKIAREELICYRLSVLRHNVVDTTSKYPKSKLGIRPSKLAKRTGYRKDKTKC